MTAVVYPLYKRDLLTASTTNLDLDQTTANISPYALLVDSGTYTYNATHEFFNSLTGIVGAANGVQITAPTISVTAVFDGADVTFTAVSGATVEAIVVYRQNAGANTTWNLVTYYDTAGGGLPVTPNGGDITIQWNASGIFQLSDAAAKHDISPIGHLGPLGLYTFRYNASPSRRRIGLIAQEVLKAIPSAVRKLNGYLHVDYVAALAA